jgi:ankyrin repeat protein
VATLLELGADVHAVDAFGNTPLHDAALNGHTSTLVKLLENGGNLEASNAHGLRESRPRTADHKAKLPQMDRQRNHPHPVKTTKINQADRSTPK